VSRGEGRSSFFIDDSVEFPSDLEDRRDKSWEKRATAPTEDGDEESEMVPYNPRMRGPVAKATIARCSDLIDSVDIPQLLEDWDQLEHHPTRGGRPSAVTMRAVLVLWLVLAWEHQPLQLKRLRDIVYERLTPETAAMLGLPWDPSISPDAWYERLRRATDRLIGIIDYLPVFDLQGRRNRHRRLEKHEWDAVLAQRERDAEKLNDRANRADVLMNRLLHATYLLLPAKLRTEKISVTIDATAVRVYARGIGKERLAGLGPNELVSIEPDAAYWARHTEDHSDDGKAPRSKMKFGHELELGVLTSNDPSRPDDIPHIVVGIGHHAPAYGPGLAARRMFANIIERGLGLHYVIGDRAYLPGAKSDDLQNFLRENDALLVMDYHKTFLGLQESYAGAIMVDGNWYCQTMPQKLIDATKRFREGEDADDDNDNLTKRERRQRSQERRERWKAAIEARKPYLFASKGGIGKQGKQVLMCPAYAGTASCPRKTETRLPKGALPLTIIAKPPVGPVRACDNVTSTTFPAHVGSKFAQHLQYGSEEWQAVYGHGRNSVESFNAFLKDGNTHALEDGSRRRLRGSVAQYFLATLMVVAANLDKINDFFARRIEDGMLDDMGMAAPEANSRRPRRSTAHQRNAHRHRQRGRAKKAHTPART